MVAVSGRARSIAAGLILAAAPLAAQTERFADSTSVTTIEVPVMVELRGRPVTGLTLDSFELYDEGRRVPITGFEEVRVDRPATIDGQPLPAGRDPWRSRTLVFLLDFTWSQPWQLERVVDGLEAVFARRDLLAPGDRVGVVGWSAYHGLLTFLEPTADRRELALSIALTRAVVESDPAATRAALAALPARDAERLLAEASLSGFNRSSLSINQGAATRDLAEDFARLFERATYPGPKVLIHLSNGIPDDYVSGASLERPRVLKNMERILVAGRKTGWAIHSANLSGLTFGTDSQLLLARDTGGRLHANSNDLTLLVEEAERSTRSFYLLAFEPQEHLDGGTFRRLEVRLKGVPRGTRARHRWGYVPEGEAN
jgi:VWFA-related protein